MLLEKHLSIESKVYQDIITIGVIQGYLRELFMPEQFPAVAMFVKHNHLFPGILKLNIHVISQYVEE